MIFQCIIIACLVISTSSYVNYNCALGKSCESCIQIPTCIWCSSNTNSRGCVSVEISQYTCPQTDRQAIYKTLCPINGNSLEKQKLDKVFKLLSSLKSYKSTNQEYPQQLSQLYPQPSSNQDVDSLNIKNLANSLSSVDSTTSNVELQQLLHKLMLLRLLKKLKKSGGSLSDEDREMLEKLTKSSVITTTTTVAPNVTDELTKLLQLLRNNKNSVLEKSSSSKATSSPLTTKFDTTIQKSTEKSVLTAINHVEVVNVTYGNGNRPLSKVVSMTPLVNTSLSRPTELVSQDHFGYCKLFQDVEACNVDHNCTWCNTLDKCIGSTTVEFQNCVANLDKTNNPTFGIDQCLVYSDKGCKSCVANDKCYWCDKSDSCHTYPFFGYIPSCGGDWYIKQCDVQLAVIVIVLPLMIILLAMITFYFCLKYCYYRRRVLRVPLFEKPGVFDYRKDKKVYFVNPDDEDSDNEFASEKLRKKFRLPMEKEPLIDPNS